MVEMITAYKVSYEDQTRYIFPVPHLFRESAESHVKHLEKAGATNLQIEPIQIEEMSAQKILIAGDVAGYQFSATKMGKRTVRRKVYNIEPDGTGGLVGLINWKKRVLIVALEYWIYDWVAVERIGWTDD